MFPIIIADLSISSSNYVSFCFVYFVFVWPDSPVVIVLPIGSVILCNIHIFL